MRPVEQSPPTPLGPSTDAPAPGTRPPRSLASAACPPRPNGGQRERPLPPITRRNSPRSSSTSPPASTASAPASSRRTRSTRSSSSTAAPRRSFGSSATTPASRSRRASSVTTRRTTGGSAASRGGADAPRCDRDAGCLGQARVQMYGVVVVTGTIPLRSRIGRDMSVQSLCRYTTPLARAARARAATSAR